MRVLLPGTLHEACAMAADSGERATPIAGGTDLLVHWPVNLAAHERTYLDLSGVRELHGLHWTDSHLEIGALATFWDVVNDPRCAKELPLLVMAARTVGAIQIQARGTWAGNIVNASPAADGVPALMACDATVVLVSADTQSAPEGASTIVRTEVPLNDFYLGYKKMRMQAGQLVERIRVPRREYRVSLFEKVGARRAQAITKVGAAVTWSDAGWRVVANSVAPTIRRCAAVERMLEAGAPVTSPEDFVAALSKDIAPINDIRSTARYRAKVLGRILYFALRGAAPGVV